MRTALCAALALFSSCSPARRVEIELVNRSERTLIVEAKTGPISRKIVLGSGDRWEGYVHGMTVSRIYVELKEKLTGSSKGSVENSHR